MATIDDQKMGVILGVKARKQGIASMVWMLFVWSGIGGIMSIICCMNGFRNAKRAKELAPDSPVVQSAYMINNIMRWFYSIASLPILISFIVYVVRTLLGFIT